MANNKKAIATRKPIEPPTTEELKCLNGFPEGSLGHTLEGTAIATLLQLCCARGFGRIPQLAEQIRDIWYHPEKVEVYQKAREERLAFIVECRAAATQAEPPTENPTC